MCVLLAWFENGLNYFDQSQSLSCAQLPNVEMHFHIRQTHFLPNVVGPCCREARRQPSEAPATRSVRVAARLGCAAAAPRIFTLPAASALCARFLFFFFVVCSPGLESGAARRPVPIRYPMVSTSPRVREKGDYLF